MRELSKYAACLALVGLAACSSLGMGRSGTQYSSNNTHSAAPAAAPVSSDVIREVQSRLQQDGYYKQGNVDGVWGSGTESALQAYQRDHNLTANGQLDMATLHSMNLASNDNPPPAQRNSMNNPNNNPPPYSDQNPPPANR